MRCPDCGVVSTPDDNYCECPSPPTCADCEENTDKPCTHCWEHIEDFSTLREYCEQRDIELSAERSELKAKLLEAERQLLSLREGIFNLSVKMKEEWK